MKSNEVGSLIKARRVPPKHFDVWTYEMSINSHLGEGWLGWSIWKDHFNVTYETEIGCNEKMLTEECDIGQLKKLYLQLHAIFGEIK